MKKKNLKFDKWTLTVEIIPEGTSRFHSSVRIEQATPKARYMPSKTIGYYGFNSYEDAMDYAKKWVSNKKKQVKTSELERQKRMAANKVPAKDFYQVGDIVYNSWGYEQTNVSFYQVINVTARSIKVKEISQSQVPGSMESHGMACDVIANKDSFIENGKQYTLRVKKEGRLSQPNSVYYFSKCDGRPKYKSWYY